MPIVIDVATPLGLRVQCNDIRWRLISRVKHPVLADRRSEVVATLRVPDQIRSSTRDAEVVLFHRRRGDRWMCAVARYNRPVGELITAYPADAIKRGDVLWTR